LEAAKLLLGLARRASKGTYKSPDGKSPLDLLSQVLEVAEKWPEDVGLDLADMPPPAENRVGEEKEKETRAEESALVGNLIKFVGAPVPTGQAPADLAPRDPDVDPENVCKMDVERVIREDGLAIYKDQAGRLWSGLATYWIKRGEFDKVRDVG
jgi:pre-mRNA-splicing factor SYF1